MACKLDHIRKGQLTRGGAFAATCLAATLVLAAACDSETEPGQSSGSGASSAGPSTSASSGGGMVVDCGDLADTTLDANCRDCANAGCCAELAACDTDACQQRFACEVACGGDTTCLADCATMHPDGDAARAITTCLENSCEVCAPAPTGICGSDVSLGSTSCDDCVTENCCTEIDACLLDTMCTTCLESGDGEPCDMNTTYDAAYTCVQDMCGTPCGGG